MINRHYALILFFSLGIAIIACKKSKTTPDIKSGLIAYYPFNGNAKDESGNSLNGQVVGAQSSTDRKGKANGALLFGANQQINIPGTESINPFPFSISFWIKIDNTSGGNIFSKYNGGMWNGYQLICGTNSSGLYGLHIYPFYLNGGQIPNGLIGNYGLNTPFVFQNINLQEWNHYVFTVDQESGKLYKNGSFVESINWRTSPGPSSNSLTWIIGGQSDRNNDPQQSWFKGKIDELRIYNKALNIQQIQYLYTL